MSTATIAGSAPATRSAARVSAVFRLHFANPTTVALMPLMIYTSIFAINWLIWLIVDIASDGAATDGMSAGTLWSGASLFIFVWLLVVAVQAMNRTFHFALGFGATRRDYYLGTVLALVVLCAAWAIVFGIAALIEDATGGWGLGGHMFAVAYFGEDPILRFWYVFVLMLFFTSLGLLAGALYVRWRTWGLIAFFVALALLPLGAGAVIVLTDGLQRFGAFLVGLGFSGVYALLLIPVAVAGILGYVALRGATSRN